MKSRFPGHYRPSKADFDALWAECLFVPDANILLHLFRYGENTRDQVLDTLERLKPRVWIPYRVGFEFQRRWRDVDQINRDAYEKLSQEIESLGKKFSNLFNEYTRHQTIDVKQEQKAIDDFVKGVCKRLSMSKEKHPTREEAERTFLKISDLIGESVGQRPSAEQLAKLIEEGQRRYDASIPPGYRDAKTKDAPDKFGDFFIWKEVLEKAKDDKKPIVMITDDVKDDWFQEFRGEKIGPRPELVEEMREYGDQRFYLYTLSQFLNYAGSFLKKKVDKDAIEEIKSDELQRRETVRKNREHSIPPFIIRDAERNIRRELQILRARLSALDEKIVSTSEGANSEELNQVPSFIRERGNLMEALRDKQRQFHAVRRYINRTPDFETESGDEFVPYALAFSSQRRGTRGSIAVPQERPSTRLEQDEEE